MRSKCLELPDDYTEMTYGDCDMCGAGSDMSTNDWIGIGTIV